VLNDALARRGLTLGQLAAVLGAIGKRGRRGTALTRSLIAKLGVNYTPAQSDGESFVIELIEASGIEPPERQILLSDEQGWIGTVDFLWRRAAVVLEMDGRWHDGPLDQDEDAERDRRIEALGLKVWRVRFRDVVRDPGRFLRQLRAAIAPVGATKTRSSDDEGEVS
jgi:uncharacterized protein DUF559